MSYLHPSTRRLRRGSGLALAAVLAASPLLATTSSTAQASPSGYLVQERHADGVTADVLPTVQMNGVAWDQKIVGNTVYVGGEFNQARPAGAAPGTNQTPRTNMLAYDITTGKLTGFVGNTNGRVNVLATSPDGSRLYVGGSFTTVNGQTRNQVAAFNTADGSLVASWTPQLNAPVYSIAATDKAVYVGGNFTSANGVSRSHLAAFDPTTGNLLGWAPSANNQVRAMVTTEDGSRVVIGGLFSLVNGRTATGTASLDANTGTLYPFAVNQLIRNGSTTHSGIYSLQRKGNQIVGGAFNFGDGLYEGLFLADAMSGSITWLADCYGDTYDATIMNSQVYAVSHHHSCENIEGQPLYDPNKYRRADAFDLKSSGTTQPNSPQFTTRYAGQPATQTIAWQPDLAAGNYTGQYQGPWTSESTDKYLVLGGEFPTVNGKPQQGLVRFAVPGVAPVKQGPLGLGDAAFTASATSSTSVALRFKSLYDLDNMGLTYQVMRDGGTTPVATVKNDSIWWSRPTLSATDTTATPGATHTYTLVVSDPDGNKVTSSPVTVTMPGGTNPAPQPTTDPTTQPAPAGDYPGTVMANAPRDYWRLDDTTALLADRTGGNPMDSWNVQRGQAGAFGGSAAIGFTGYAVSPGSAAAARYSSSVGAVSQELWFRSTSTSGGVMMDLGSSRTGSSSWPDLVLHLTNDGKVVYSVGTSGWSPSSRITLASAAGQNNGAWHHVVASVGSGGTKLYLDGRLVASNSTVTRPVTGSGYWRIGGDSNRYLQNSSASYFTGTLDEVAWYGSQLSDATVRAHATAGGLTVG